jgi:hypothetical protein
VTANDAFDIQVPPEHYAWATYDTQARWASYWHQIDEIVATSVETCLEIGVGSGVVAASLRQCGIAVTCVDIEPALGVDRIGDVRELPCDDGEFEAVSCCQVLEHLPWSDVPRAVAELQRVAARYLLVSLPQSGRFIGIQAFLPTGKRVGWADAVSFRRPLQQGEEHYWQVGSPGASRRAVRRMLSGDGPFVIAKEFVVLSNPYHRFYLLERQGLVAPRTMRFTM